MGCGGAAAEGFWFKLVALRKDQICSARFVGDLFGKGVVPKSGIPKCSNIKSSAFPLEFKDAVSCKPH